MGLYASKLRSLQNFIFHHFPSVLNPYHYFYIFRYILSLRSKSDGRVENVDNIIKANIARRRKILPAQEDKHIPVTPGELEFIEECRVIQLEENECYRKFKVKKRFRKRRKLEIVQEVILRGLSARYVKQSLDNSSLFVDMIQTKITARFKRTDTSSNYTN